MALSQSIQQKQAGSLTLTPQLRQAIKLLELSNLDLETYLAQEILDNPLLELASQEDTASPDGENPQENITDNDSDSDSDNSNDNDSDNGKASEHSNAENDFDPIPDRDDSASEEYDNLWTNQSEADRWENASSSGGSSSSTTSSSSDLDDAASRLVANPVTLREYLTSQLHTDFSDPIDLLIGTHLIEGLDESGYLTTPLQEIAEKLGCAENRVCNTLHSLQKCEPSGVFAQSLIECLRLQLIDQKALTPSLSKLLEHLSLYADGKIDDLLKITALTRQELADHLHHIQSLNPRPGLLFETPSDQNFHPDVFVRWHDAKQEWRIHLNEATLPKILIDTGYYARVTSKGEKEINAYLKERLQSASWLAKALDQRAQTILKVSSEIVQQQEAFLKKGLRYLKPMTLKDIAVAVDLHESTVSRVTQHKYMMTPRGTFDMKTFFSSSVASMKDDGTHSASSVQHLIQSLVTSESPQAPYSDDQLVQELAEKGIDVARRTISKYRKIMNIPSSYERKKYHLRQI